MTEKKRHPFLRFLGRTLIVLLSTVLLLVAFLYGVMYLLCRGPSPTAREQFVLSTRETSAVGFLPRLYLSEEEIAAIAERPAPVLLEHTDPTLVTVQESAPTGGEPDAWGYTDEDGDGLILVNVHGESFVGYMLIVLDPSRVIMGCVPESFYYRGYTLAELVEHFGAVAGINGGGFDDPNGMGDGDAPESCVVFEGKPYLIGNGMGADFSGFDRDHILHVNIKSPEEIEALGIQYGTGYGPVLVVNGETADFSSLRSGLNPRTAIGQRSDGAVLMLVIEGRQPNSLGASYADEAEMMLKFGAVNATNLDGGSSSLMWYGGDYVNAAAFVVGIRPIPTSFLVLPEGVEK